jgi:hypothetical protein
MAKATLIRMTGEGEQLQFEVDIPGDIWKTDSKNREHKLNQLLSPFFGALDMRMMEINHRIMDAMNYSKGLSPEQQMQIKTVFDIMGGRAPQLNNVQPEQSQLDADKAAILAEHEKLAEQGEAISEGKVVSISKNKLPAEDGV